LTPEVRHYLDGVAKYLVERVYGPAGPPLDTTLTQIEHTIASLRSNLTEQVLAHALTRQAQATADAAGELACPSCKGDTLPREPEPRIVNTTVGSAQWSEPQRYCPRCRKCFFPAVTPSGA
jgi:hypothetical protein